MNIRPYLTFDGNCATAIELYETAFMTKADQVAKFSDMPPNPNFQIPEEHKDRILQATINFGSNFLRLSDCGPTTQLNTNDTHKIAIAVEAEVDVVKNAFEVLSREGEVGMPLAETFFSPCHGVVFDKFGIQWNMIGTK